MADMTCANYMLVVIMLAACSSGVQGASPVRSGDILLDGTVERAVSGENFKPFFEVRSPAGVLRSRIIIPTTEPIEIFGTTATRKLAFTVFQDTTGTKRMHVSSLSGSSPKIVATVELPNLTGPLSGCGIDVSDFTTAVATTDPAITHVYVSLVCGINLCSGTKTSPSYIIALRYSSKTKKLTGPFKKYRDTTAKCSNFLVNYATPPTFIGGSPYVVGSRFQAPNQLYKLTEAGPRALGAKLNLPELPDGFPLARCGDFHVAGTSSFYAVCETEKRSTTLPQFAVYQFRKDAAPRIVGKLPARMSVFGFLNQGTPGLIATTPSLKTMYVIAATPSGDGGISHFDLLSLDRTKITSPFRERWRLPSSLTGRVALKVIS